MNYFSYRRLWCHYKYVLLLFNFFCLLVLYSSVTSKDKVLQIFGFKQTEKFISTCSKNADRRGSHQKVIAFTVWGDFKQNDFVIKYLRPLEENIGRISQNFPGWVVRIYHNFTKDDDNSEKILENKHLMGSHVDMCNVTEVMEKLNLKEVVGRTWRWVAILNSHAKFHLPLLDEMVDVLMSRDTDSYILSREEDAVQDWLDSDGIFHIMRDHPYHCVHILAGLWGVKLNLARSKYYNAAQKIFYNTKHSHEYIFDQDLLKDIIWPIAIASMVAHDSFCCKIFPFTRPYPTQREGYSFIGMKGLPTDNDEFRTPECPESCRPNHNISEWLFC